MLSRVHNISAKLIHRRPRKVSSNATFKYKIQKTLHSTTKLQELGLFIIITVPNQTYAMWPSWWRDHFPWSEHPLFRLIAAKTSHELTHSIANSYTNKIQTNWGDQDMAAPFFVKSGLIQGDLTEVFHHQHQMLTWQGIELFVKFHTLLKHSGLFLSTFSCSTTCQFGVHPLHEDDAWQSRIVPHEFLVSGSGVYMPGVRPGSN